MNYTEYYQLTQVILSSSAITCTKSINASYIPITEIKDFTAHLILFHYPIVIILIMLEKRTVDYEYMSCHEKC